MTLRSTTVGLHVERQAQTAREAFVASRGEYEALIRQVDINLLPRVDWKEKTLYTLRCHGTSGKGPHETNVPEALLWALMDWRAFRCPYHANDAAKYEEDFGARGQTVRNVNAAGYRVEGLG